MKMSVSLVDCVSADQQNALKVVRASKPRMRKSSKVNSPLCKRLQGLSLADSRFVCCRLTWFYIFHCFPLYTSETPLFSSIPNNVSKHRSLSSAPPLRNLTQTRSSSNGLGDDAFTDSPPPLRAWQRPQRTACFLRWLTVQFLPVECEEGECEAATLKSGMEQIHESSCHT